MKNARLLTTISDIKKMKLALNDDIFQNAIFLFRVFEIGHEYDIYYDNETRAAMAIDLNEALVVFSGNWTDTTIPFDKLPQAGFFTHGCPTSALTQLKNEFKIDYEGPCWKYVSSGDIGDGPWDDLGGLEEGDAALIAEHWDLIDDPEDIIKEKIRKFDSACVRVDGELVSWVGLHYEIKGMAELGFAHTLDDHRRKGYLAMSTKALVKRINGRGGKAVAHMFKSNEASVSLAESVGFERVGEATWAEIGARYII